MAIYNIANVTNNGGLVEITTTTSNVIATGNTVQITQVNGTVSTASDGIWVVTVIGANQFTLNGSTFSGSYINSGWAYLNQDWDGELPVTATAATSALQAPPPIGTTPPLPPFLVGGQAPPLAELMMPSTGAIKYYQMRGWYVSGEIYETWVVANVPSSTPPSGHILIKIEIAATWTQ